jgi:putative SOS response-associated peptidase YedK
MANAVVGPVHHRMPVLLHPAHYAMWLDAKTAAEDLQAMLRPYDGPMTDTAVGTYVNSARNQGPQCIEAV